MKQKDNLLQKLYPHRRGIMGTVIFHLLLAIILVSMELNKIEEHREAVVLVDPPIEKKIEEKKEEPKEEKKVEKVQDQEIQELLKSLATNENAEKRSSSADRKVAEYIEEMEEQIDRRGYSHRYKKQVNKEFIADSLQHLKDQKEAELDSLKSTFYSGKSSVSYNLVDRFARRLPIPVFKCEFGGTVVVIIQVDQRGVVQKAYVQKDRSASDECLQEVAIDASLRSKFNAKSTAPSLQQGTITYHFVSQD